MIQMRDNFTVKADLADIVVASVEWCDRRRYEQ